ncbi:MAG: hypothetical protein KDC18_17750 [Alphaproteobacteria bacterium]|nr:hypothetical protein [Alphaproteobacteria bacterium]MCB9928363.1 hypothetical protein [Alphaproteobacteria bacterium]
MLMKGSVLPRQAARLPSAGFRRWLDANGARTWLWAAIALGLLWVGMMVHLPY